LALAYGAFGEATSTTEGFLAALPRALAHIKATGLPALIELRYDGNLITPGMTLDAMREAALAASK
jgi:acetolactate synthase-1/2/3 large subunit